MIVVHENVAVYTETKPMMCIKCGYKRAFDVPEGAFVRKARHGKPPQDVVLLKCKKCGNVFAVSTEQVCSVLYLYN